MKNPIRAFCLLLLLAGTFQVHAQVPVLNSHPSSSAVLFLDFDGHTVNGTAWNYNGPIVCGGSGLDQNQAKEVFHRVSEDFAPFDLNVTTDSTVFLHAPADKRMRVIITISSSWYGVAGGVAFVGSFNWGDDTPCFIFSALHQYRVKDISEATSHEAGHTLGLFHQSNYDAACNKLSDYHWGTGTGEIGWAPIMGAGYSKNFTVWHNGANSWGCDSYQSDLEIITSGANGFGYRTDDHSNSFVTPTIPVFTANQFSVAGVIEKNTDKDLFRFIMPGTGLFQLDAIPNNVGSGNLGSDLDMQVSLYSETQTLLSVYNPGTLLSSLVDTFLNAGTYYLRIEGRGNAYASNYASLGSYSLLGKITNASSPLPLHRLELTGSQNGDKRQFSWIIDADEEVMEQVLEVAVDGKNFIPLTGTTNETRNYIYRATDAGKSQYRLNVTFSNGRRSYSNVVTINFSDAGPHPKLAGNLVRSSSIYVSSPAKFNYTVIDFNGRVMKQGQLANGINEVNASGLSAGMYVIRFDGNDQQWTEKFVRQ
ncbi:MAG: T9SS type A sorting domain-containing protein [Chitinophagaceae bacterium]|nr:MAG: T9SS type A sorting domain-containing protein [Chitinophagaceae bacterium]